MSAEAESEWAEIHNEMVMLLAKMERYHGKYWASNDGKTDHDIARAIDRLKESMMWWQIECGYHLNAFHSMFDTEGE